jgi:uncharacterized membrane protein
MALAHVERLELDLARIELERLRAVSGAAAPGLDKAAVAAQLERIRSIESGADATLKRAMVQMFKAS